MTFAGRRVRLDAAIAAAGILALVGAAAAAAQETETQPTCPEGQRITDVQPQHAIVARLQGKDAQIFVESCLEHGSEGRTATFDLVLILSGPDVLGGTMAVMAQGECPVAHKFLGLVELIHAEEMVALFHRHPALQSVEHLDLGILTGLAEAGDAAAAFHVGFVQAMGWGAPHDRPGSIGWLRRSAESGYAPGMLALGMSLAGPGVIDEQVLPVGTVRPRDAQTDLAEACYWLRRLQRAHDDLTPLATSVYRDEVAPRLSSVEEDRCDVLLRESMK